MASRIKEGLELLRQMCASCKETGHVETLLQPVLSGLQDKAALFDAFVTLEGQDGKSRVQEGVRGQESQTAASHPSLQAMD